MPVIMIWFARSSSRVYPSCCGPRAPSVSPDRQSSGHSRRRIERIFAAVSGLLVSTVVLIFVKSFVIVTLLISHHLHVFGFNAQPHGEAAFCHHPRQMAKPASIAAALVAFDPALSRKPMTFPRPDLLGPRSVNLRSLISPSSTLKRCPRSSHHCGKAWS